jgi:hypothetical protein
MSARAAIALAAALALAAAPLAARAQAAPADLAAPPDAGASDPAPHDLAPALAPAAAPAPASVSVAVAAKPSESPIYRKAWFWISIAAGVAALSGLIYGAVWLGTFTPRYTVVKF